MLCCLHLLRLLKLQLMSWWHMLNHVVFVEPLAKKLVTNLFVEPLANVRELVHLQVGKLSHKASPTCTILAYIHHSETESKLEMLCSRFFLLNFVGVNIAKEEKGVMHIVFAFC